MDNNNSLEYTQIKNTSVVDAVKDWVIDQLIKGNLRPGSKLPTETELRENLGASRNSVREAIKQLEAYGVVYIKRAEGTFVSDSYDPKMLSPVMYSIILQNNSWEDFVDLRRAIDIGTLYVIMNKAITDKQLDRLQEAIARLEETVNSSELDVVKITKADCDFHNEIIRMTGNPQLTTLSDFVNRITVPSREKTTGKVIESGQIESYVRLHRQLYNIIAERDRNGIEKAVMDHYYFWERYID
ncbi:MAG TPA: FadR family transcriptional regulator [Candidatus Scatomorpha merdigallinarum]|nr:FadR family transcriptional regulator [Candidatus Scatomorpha merdigallinarum]